MIDLLSVQKHFILQHLKAGDIAVDFTMGNGNDTLFLSETVGENGHVYAFDIQEKALVSTKEHLTAKNAPENYTLLCKSHHLVRDYVKEPFVAGMFNLGYLPGSGHKEVTTKRETTLKAIEEAIDLMANGGILMIAVYPGHEEGRIEGELIEEQLSSISRFAFCISKFQIINSPTSPFFFLVEKK